MRINSLSTSVFKGLIWQGFRSEHSMQISLTGWRASGGAQNNGEAINIWPGTATGHCLPKFIVTLVSWCRELCCRGKPAAGRGARHHRLPSGSALRISKEPQKGEKQSQRFGRRTLKVGRQFQRRWRPIQRGWQRNWRPGWPVQRRRRRIWKLWGRQQWNTGIIRRWRRCLGSGGDNFWLRGGHATRSKQIQAETNRPSQGFVSGNLAGVVLVGARAGVVDVVGQRGSTTIAAAAIVIDGQGLRHSMQGKSWKSVGQALRGQPSRRSAQWSLPWVNRGTIKESERTSLCSSLKSRKRLKRKHLQEGKTHPLQALDMQTPCRLHQAGKEPQGRRSWPTPPLPRQRKLQTQPSGLPCGRVSLRVGGGAQLWRRNLLRTSNPPMRAPAVANLTQLRSRSLFDAGYMVRVRFRSVFMLFLIYVQSFFSHV